MEPRTGPHCTLSKGKTSSLLINLQWLPLKLNLTPHQGPRGLTRSGFCLVLSPNHPPFMLSFTILQLQWSLVCVWDTTTFFLLKNLHLLFPLLCTAASNSLHGWILWVLKADSLLGQAWHKKHPVNHSLRKDRALVSMAQVFGVLSCNQKVAGSIPNQGTS